jgi:hypothetical protein
MSLKIRKLYPLIFFLALSAGVISIFGQTAPPEPPTVRIEKPEKKLDLSTKVSTSVSNKTTVNITTNSNFGSSEKAIVVDPKVNISLCVLGGNLKVNGWDRNEVRVFVNEGTPVGFKIRQKNKQTEKPVWINVVSFDKEKNAASNDECVSAESIEIDAPRNAVLDIRSQESRMRVDSIGKVSIKNVVGDIMLNNIANGIEAVTYEGDVVVEKSSGAISVQSIAGNIAVSNASPSEIGDIFKAKTNNGAISLQGIEHRQLEVNTNSGSIKYTGEILANGQYTFGTQNGSILLNVPTDSSCKISATYGYGSFNSEIPLQKIEKNPSPQTKSMTAMMGTGEAMLNFTTFNGSINIKKQ